MQLGENKFKKEELTSKIKKWQQEKVKMKKELDEISEKVGSLKKQFNNTKRQKEKIRTDLDSIIIEKRNINKEIENLIKEQAELSNKIDKNKQFLEKYNELKTKKEKNQNQIKDKEIP